MTQRRMVVKLVLDNLPLESPVFPFVIASGAIRLTDDARYSVLTHSFTNRVITRQRIRYAVRQVRGKAARVRRHYEFVTAFRAARLVPVVADTMPELPGNSGMVSKRRNKVPLTSWDHPKALSPGRTTLAARNALRAASMPLSYGVRPVVVGDCAATPRPCPYVSCQHHLYALTDERGGIRLAIGGDVGDALRSMRFTCALDVVAAQPDGMSLDEVGAALGGLTRERVRQLERSALAKVRQWAKAAPDAGRVMLEALAELAEVRERADTADWRSRMGDKFRPPDVRRDRRNRKRRK